MMIWGTPDMAAVPGCVHGRAGRSRDRRLRRGCNRLCDACHHMAGGVRERSGQVPSTAVALSAVAAARQGWHGDELGPDQDGLEFG